MKHNEGVLTYKYTPEFCLLSEAVYMTNGSKVKKIEQNIDDNFEPIKKPVTKRKSGYFQPRQPICLPSHLDTILAIDKILQAFNKTIEVQIITSRHGEIKTLSNKSSTAEIWHAS